MANDLGPRQRVRNRARDSAHHVLSAAERAALVLHRRRLMVAVRRQNLARDAHVVLDLADDVLITGPLVLNILPGAIAKVSVGSGCTIEAGVELRIRAGSLSIGNDCYIRRNSVLAVGGDFTIGSEVTVSWGCYLMCDSELHIGDRVGMAQNCSFIDSGHFFTSDDRMAHQNMSYSAVNLANDIWLGANVTVLPGASIGHHSIVAAGAVVRGSNPEWSLLMGVPSTSRPLPATLGGPA